VLDLGCGTGYGTQLLAAHCSEAVGVDISAEAVEYAASHHAAPNVEYRRIGPLPAERLPFEDQSFEVIVAFQVIEHVAEVGALVDEIARVIEPGGVALIATPDRSTRLFRWQRPWNPFHVTEYDAEGLRRVLEWGLRDVELLRMSADEGVVEIELRRARALRLATLPFTFPGAPERWRLSGLRALRAIRPRRPSRAAGARRSFGFGVEQIVIGPAATPALHLIAVAHR
jgi:2-polyprenyl-3-methyl-5-hydroxy-6-metoxy-1,4-benzoquinol methylase